MAVLQGTRPRVISPASSQAVVLLLEVISKVIEEMCEEEEELDDADLIEIAEKTIEEFLGFTQLLAHDYQPKIYFEKVSDTTDQTEYIKAVTLGLTKGATFPVTIAGT